jgi:hypothetical protein
MLGFGVTCFVAGLGKVGATFATVVASGAVAGTVLGCCCTTVFAGA